MLGPPGYVDRINHVAVFKRISLVDFVLCSYSARLVLRCRDTCDLKALGINTDSREAAATDRSNWKQAVHKGPSRFEDNLTQQAEENWSRVRHGSMLADRRPASPAESATESATPASVSSATPDEADETGERTQRRRTAWSPHGLPRPMEAYCY